MRKISSVENKLFNRYGWSLPGCSLGHAAEGEWRTYTLPGAMSCAKGPASGLRQGLAAPLHPRLEGSPPKTPGQPSAGWIPPAPCRAGPAVREPCSPTPSVGTSASRHPRPAFPRWTRTRFCCAAQTAGAGDAWRSSASPPPSSPRSNGHSVIAAAAYRAGKNCSLTSAPASIKDYSRRRWSVCTRLILTPENAPAMDAGPSAPLERGRAPRGPQHPPQ